MLLTVLINGFPACFSKKASKNYQAPKYDQHSILGVSQLVEVGVCCMCA